MLPHHVEHHGTRHLRTRRLDHLKNRRHADCNVCWLQEDRGQLSPRRLLPRPDPISQALDPYSPAMLEITMGNLCDLACRYCSSVHSSVWAQREQDSHNIKLGRSHTRTDDRYKKVFPQFQQWLRDKIPDLNQVWFTGGEVTLMDSFYDLLDSVRFQNLNIGISTNLNTPDAYAERLSQAIQRLLQDGNNVMLRVSMDGVGDQNDWQRQGSDWSRIEKNWYRFGSMNVELGAAFTVTALTLEGMLDVAKFVLQSRYRLVRPPTLYQINTVLWPTALDPSEWISAFRDQWILLLELIEQNDLRMVEDNLARSLRDWIDAPPGLPSMDQVKRMTVWLDDAQHRWGGQNWRSVYPRIDAICQQVLLQHAA